MLLVFLGWSLTFHNSAPRVCAETFIERLGNSSPDTRIVISLPGAPLDRCWRWIGNKLFSAALVVRESLAIHKHDNICTAYVALRPASWIRNCHPPPALFVHPRELTLTIPAISQRLASDSETANNWPQRTFSRAGR